MSFKCPGCKQPIKNADIGDPKTRLREDRYWHHSCDLKRDPQFPLMEQLFKLQDDSKADPKTALADLIGNLGHFATIKRIDFPEAVRRGLGYWEDEK